MITISPVADDTAELEGVLADIFASGKGAKIHFNPGDYVYTRSIKLHPDANGRTWKNLEFEGEGDGYAMNSSVVLKYQADANTDPDFANGLFDINHGCGLHFSGMCLMNESDGVNQLVRMRADAANLLSLWKCSFKRMGFQNLTQVSKQLANGHVWLYNTLDTRFEQCWHFGSPVNMTLGCDPAITQGIAGGYTGRIRLDNSYFTGDVKLLRTSGTLFHQSTMNEKWSNSGAPTQGAQIVIPDVAYSGNLAVKVDACQLTGLFNNQTYTDQAIDAAGTVRGLHVTDSTVWKGYTRAVKVGAKATGVRVDGNDSDQTGPGARVVDVMAGFKGALTVEDNTLSDAAITAGTVEITDARTYKYPYTVNVAATANYDIVAQNTWETALSSAAVSYPRGRYRVSAGALLTSGYFNANLGIRITNTAGFVSANGTMNTFQGANFVCQAALDEIVELPEGVNVTWRLQALDLNSNAGSVRALGLGNKPGTFLRVERVG